MRWLDGITDSTDMGLGGLQELGIHSSVFKDHMLLGVKANFTILLWQAAAAAKSLQLCPTLCNPIDGSPLGSPVPGFSRQEHWSGLPFPSPVHESEK